MSVMADDPKPERPRAEPEIILPGEQPAPRRPAGVFVRFDEQGGVHRVFIARPGLPSVLLALLIIGLVAALVFLVLAGIVLFWIPILIIGLLAAFLSGAFRRLR